MEIDIIVWLKLDFHSRNDNKIIMIPPSFYTLYTSLDAQSWDPQIFSFVKAWGLSQECVLRIPSVIVKGDLMGRCVGITV